MKATTRSSRLSYEVRESRTPVKLRVSRIVSSGIFTYNRLNFDRGRKWRGLETGADAGKTKLLYEINVALIDDYKQKEPLIAISVPDVPEKIIPENIEVLEASNLAAQVTANLIEQILQQESKLTKEKIAEIAEEIAESIFERLKTVVSLTIYNGNAIEIPGFGTFVPDPLTKIGFLPAKELESTLI